jgi:hypothetical protein
MAMLGRRGISFAVMLSALSKLIVKSEKGL